MSGTGVFCLGLNWDPICGHGSSAPKATHGEQQGVPPQPWASDLQRDCPPPLSRGHKLGLPFPIPGGLGRGSFRPNGPFGCVGCPGRPSGSGMETRGVD